MQALQDIDFESSCGYRFVDCLQQVKQWSDAHPTQTLDHIRPQLERSVRERVSVLCCPEALIGGLADFATDPFRYAVTTAQLESLLQPLSSETVPALLNGVLRICVVVPAPRLMKTPALLKALVPAEFRSKSPSPSTIQMLPASFSTRPSLTMKRLKNNAVPV